MQDRNTAKNCPLAFAGSFGAFSIFLFKKAGAKRKQPGTVLLQQPCSRISARIQSPVFMQTNEKTAYISSGLGRKPLLSFRLRRSFYAELQSRGESDPGCFRAGLFGAFGLVLLGRRQPACVARTQNRSKIPCRKVLCSFAPAHGWAGISNSCCRPIEPEAANPTVRSLTRSHRRLTLR